MRYIKVFIIVLSILAAMIFGIHNPMAYTLSFLSYRLIPDIPLWALLLLSFLLGTVPVIMVGLPEKTSFLKSMRELKQKKKNIEKSLKDLNTAKPIAKA